MKASVILFGVILLGVAAAGTAQVNLPNPSAPGSSPNTAVVVTGTSELMVDRYIRRWLRAKYPDWSAEPHQYTDIGMDRYAVAYITHPDHPARRVYFRVMQSPNEDDRPPFPTF